MLFYCEVKEKIVISITIKIGRVSFNKLYSCPLFNNSVFLRYTKPTSIITGIEKRFFKSIVILEVFSTIPPNPNVHILIKVRDIK
ncbi:hypothetical protein GCM10008924_27690 [Gracilibacillus halotolerans]